MMRIEMQLIGQPKEITDARGTWRSAIFRVGVNGPVELGLRGLPGDQVGDTEHHGSPDQAVCCHPLAHYAAWNRDYGLTERDWQLGPGAVGENWTIAGATEADVCIGDVWAVGSGAARVQVTMPRFPCWKQERKVGLPDFLRRTKETLRTGWYLRVLETGMVQEGDELALVSRPQPELTVERINAHLHRDFDPDFAHALLEVPELADGWKKMIKIGLSRLSPE